MSAESPNQKRRRAQHEKTIATFDTLLGGFAPLTELGKDGATPPRYDATAIAAALRQAAIGISTVLQQMKDEAVAEYESARWWP